MSDRIRWGICGAGSIAGQFATALAEIDDAELVAVASTDAQRGTDFAERHGAARTHLGYDALAADDQVDVVYVASTQDRHHDDVITFLQGGRNVLCEKPFALSGTQARNMIDEAGSSGLFLMEALWSRFLPSYERLIELIEDGAIGEPRRVESDFSFRVPDDETDGHRLFDPHRGGGALLDLGVYPVQLAHLVLGPPETIEATAHLNGDGIDEATAIVLGHAGGAQSVLTTAIRTRGTCTARIAGTEGVLHLDAFMHCTSRIRLERGLETETFDFDPPSLGFQVPEVHRCLRAGLSESPRMPHSATLEIMAILDAVRDRVGLTFPGE